MKSICFVAFLLFTTLPVVSQSILIDPTDLTNIQSENNPLFPKIKQPVLQNKYQFKVGTIYKLPLDNMPCLFPDISSIAPIPTLTFNSPGQKIPNPYFGSNLFPTFIYKNGYVLPK